MFSQLNKLSKHFSWKRIINNLKFLIKNDLLEERYILKDEIIEDCVYEYEELKNTLPRLTVLNETETLEVLRKTPKSFSRYGDGEILMIRGQGNLFQDYDEELSAKLKQLLTEKRDNLYIGLNCSYFQSPVKYSEHNRRFYRLYGTSFRRVFVDLCDPNNIYLDACCFGGYFRQGENFDIDKHFDNVKELFRNKKIAVVCGEGILDEISYNIFEFADDIKYIAAPKVNAFDKYEQILTSVKTQVKKDWLVCIILGMTATVLAADLADLGYTAWDIGHAAKEYDAYMRKVEKTPTNINSFFAPD